MKASTPGGRFHTNFEVDSILKGIGEDLRRPVGMEVDWWRFDAENTEIDPIYDTGSSGAGSVGRRWQDPFKFPVIVAQVFQGQTMQNDRGFYNTDVLRLTVSMEDVQKFIPTLVPHPDDHMRDRVVYRGSVFRPSRMYLRGQVLTQYTILTIDLIQVVAEEMVNDDQFASFSA